MANTNLFCSEHKGIPRIRMPQLSGEAVAGTQAAEDAGGAGKKINGAKAFVSFLRDQLGIDVEKRSVRAAKLKASQSELVGTKVAEMMSRLNFTPNRIFVSRDHYVIDGHHNWAAAVGRDAKDGKLGNLKMDIYKVDAPISEILHIANRWSKKYGIAPKAGK